MAKTKIKMNAKPLSIESTISLSVLEFVKLHDTFVNLKRLEGLAPRTLRDYVTHMNYLKKWLNLEQRLVGNRWLEKALFNEYSAHMILKQYAPCTINVRLRTLKTYLNWLQEEGYLNENLASKIKLVRVPKDTIKPLISNEIKQMLKAVNTSNYTGFRDYCLMILMLDNGIRVNEAVNVTLNDVDIKRKVIIVRSETAKTRTERFLPISKKTAGLLDQLIETSKDNGEEYLFLSSLGGKLDPLVIIHNFGKHGKKAGITKRCSPHVWRHTFAVNAVKGNMDVFTLQRILGHASLTTTRQYIQLDDEFISAKHSEAGVLDRFV